MVAGPAMDAGGGGGGGGGGRAGVSAPAAANGSYGLVRTVVGYSTSPLFFWFLTVLLVAVIHIVSGSSKPSSSSRADEERERERERERKEREKARRDREREASGRGDDRVLEMMRSFSFMQATEEDYMEGMTAYDYNYNGVDAGGTAHGPVAPEPFAPSPASTAASLSFKFQHQMHEIPTEPAAVVSREFTAAREETAAVVSREFTADREEDEREREEEKESLAPLQSADKQEHHHEAEETEFVVEEEVEEQSREVVQEEAAPPKIVATTHNYQFLTERDFRGFVREPEAMTVRVQESFVPPSPPPSHHTRRSSQDDRTLDP